MSNREELYAAKLRELASQLEGWAIEARAYGWSTQHADPMMRKASEIYALLGRHYQAAETTNNAR